MSERYNLTVPRKYDGKDGEEKTAWDPVGVMFKRDKGGYSIVLSMFPDLHIFAFPPKDEESSNTRRGAVRDSNPEPDESDIPF